MRKILVIRYGTIGDSIFASAFYRELRTALPDAEIDILVDDVAKGVMKNCPYINNIFSINGKYKNFFNYISLFKKYDTVYFLKNDSFFTQIAFFAGVKQRIGFKLFRNKFLNIKVPYENNRHEVDCYLDLLKASGICVNNTETELWLNAEDNKKAKELTSEISNKKVLIQAYSRIPQKNWIDEYWIKVVKYLINEENAQVFFAGGKKDNYENITEAFSDNNTPPIDLTGKMSVSETMSLINEMDLVIGIDSGLIHMAAALNIPSILLHGATSLLRWSPRSENCTILSKYFPCSPCCLQPNSKQHCKNQVSKCMKALLPDMVIKTIIEKFNNLYKS